ncbi:SGNH/GDSL hydrolase family protein, partial [Jatrophihabitans endophyticus]|uniref:SGNH/GDSL hydrolase family protein n=1 Tax=Jatrophihabitans endophyticus TaxID=1206085 RepID=UPI0026EBD8BF
MRVPTASRIAVGALAAAGLAVAALALPAGATPQAKHHLRYVAMGDSYSAASGNTPPDPSAAPQCLRSTVNYPHLIAAKTHATLHDVTCGGAEDSDFFSAQYPGVPAQLKAVHKNTQLVTMTIGGNDSNVFIDSIAECGAAGISTGGTGHPCKDRYGNSFDKTIRTKTYPAIVKSLRAVHKKAPHARVAILTYPWILPKKTGCFPSMPVAKGDVPYLRNEQATLNSAVVRAAKK